MKHIIVLSALCIQINMAAANVQNQISIYPNNSTLSDNQCMCGDSSRRCLKCMEVIITTPSYRLEQIDTGTNRTKIDSCIYFCLTRFLCCCPGEDE